ncbi:MAG: replicative DNA helicase [Chloroflexi bacterium]|nr:replicative DNA helicase [Chloroflexota bacterium]
MSSQPYYPPTQNVPFSQEAEEAVIGSVLVNPAMLPTVAAFLKPDDFFLLRHSYIWQALLGLMESDTHIDYLTLIESLRGSGRLDAVGGEVYIIGLFRNTPTSVHAETYGRLVERAAMRRRLMAAADEIRGLALNETMPIEEVVTSAETRLFHVTERQLKNEIVPIREAISQYFDRIEYMMQNQQEALGVPTGFKDLDSLLGGLQKSDFIIFAGRPGMGKTSFLLSVVLNAARAGARTAVFTMEMASEQIVQRIIAMETGINMQKLRLGQIDQREWSRFVEAIGRLGELSIFIDDTPALNPVQLRTKARRLQHEHGVDLIVLDYLQLMNGGTTFENNRVQEISYISRHMKELAKEMNVPILSAAQLSRAVEQRHDKRPILSDLRESGSLEQDTDVVMFLYRDVVYNEATEFPNQADILVSKHRNGPTGTISLYFEKSITKFMDAAVRNIDLSEL